MERCKWSVETFGSGPGPCPGLEYEDGRAWCGLLRDPLKYIEDGLHEQIDDLFRPALAGEIQRQLAYSLAIGSGCDSDDPQPQPQENKHE